MRALFVLLAACSCVWVSACADHPKKPASNKKVVLQTIDRGPHRPKTYLYREVDQ